jgi:hypothetical protein
LNRIAAFMLLTALSVAEAMFSSGWKIDQSKK